jgi:mannosyltransferase OCH1-like enzyme
MIPKMLHRIWLGETNIPAEFDTYWYKWMRLHPEWVFQTWLDTSFDWLHNRALFDAAETLSEKSDIARYEILAQFGGVYVDTDQEPLRNIDELLFMGAFAAYETPGHLAIGMLGAETLHPAALALVKELPVWLAAHANEPKRVDIRTGPHFLTHVWGQRTDVWQLPSWTFYPYGYWEKEKKGGPYPPMSYAVHHWAASWQKGA